MAVVLVAVAAAAARVALPGCDCLINHQLKVDGSPPVRTIVLNVAGPRLAFDVDKDTSCKGRSERLVEDHNLNYVTIEW